MTIRTLFLHVNSETCDPRRGAVAYTLRLARSFGAQLEALVLELDDVAPNGVHDGPVAEAAHSRTNSRTGQAALAADALRAEALDRGVEALIMTDRLPLHSTPETVAIHGRLVDLVLTGVCEKGTVSERVVAESLIFQSGRPVIIVPDVHRGYGNKRVLVAWDFSRAAARALSDALPFLHRAGEVTLVTFTDDKEFPTSLIQDQILDALRRRGVTARFLQMERGDQAIGDAINDAAMYCRADLLVMGGYGHSRLRDFVLGGATRTILSRPTVPTLMSH